MPPRPTYNPYRVTAFMSPTQQASSRRASQTNYEQDRRQYELEYFDSYGYYPNQRRENEAAGQAAEQEWGQLVQEIQDQMERLDIDPTAMQIRDFYTGVQGGKDLPFSGGTLESLISQATTPMFTGAQRDVSRTRESFASRGLGRSGGLGSLEQQILSDAVLRANQASSGLRAQGAIENFGARERATTGLSSFYNTQSAQRADLTKVLAGLRAQKSFDPNFFRARTGEPTPAYMTQGSDRSYRVPPPARRRSVGASAPQFSTQQAWHQRPASTTGGRSLGF